MKSTTNFCVLLLIIILQWMFQKKLSNEFPDENIPIVEPGINDVVKEEQENDFVEIKPEPTAIIMDDPLISADSEHLDAQQIELNFEAINEITVDGIKSEFVSIHPKSEIIFKTDGFRFHFHCFSHLATILLHFAQENYRRSDNYTSTTARIGKDIVKNHADCAPAVEPDQNKRKNQSTKKLSKAIQDVCDECNKTFLYAGSLERHKRAVHQRIRPYACKQCSKRFFQLNDLLRHNQVHNEVREMYTCDLCGKKFIQRSTLANHKMKIHQQIHLHECHLCAKRFQQIGQLKKHFVVHTGRSKHFSKKIDRNRRKNNVCNECDRSFVDSNCLLRHKRLIHQGIHPHACESCDKRFSEYTQLKIHMRTHTRKN